MGMAAIKLTTPQELFEMSLALPWDANGHPFSKGQAWTCATGKGYTSNRNSIRFKTDPDRGTPFLTSLEIKAQTSLPLYFCSC